ncbi:hypothetical protein ACT3TP_03065 [Glutamicibacter sp. AOP38-B1-38]|uniref:hypothetical protein n=1 Tax=Glutamicibacter sp. AOP38-B1-38 TaxID=3457680 RepID=UPI0040331903
MSTRAIAPIVGKSVGQVHADRVAGVQLLNASNAEADRETDSVQSGAAWVESGDNIPLETGA